MKQTDLALKIFDITAEMESMRFDNMGAQREFCERVTALFAQPPWVAKCALRDIVAQLRSCEYHCKAGPLRLNTAFIALEELAEAS